MVDAAGDDMSQLKIREVRLLNPLRPAYSWTRHLENGRTKRAGRYMPQLNSRKGTDRLLILFYGGAIQDFFCPA